jgi:GGDEF domain-containing protein
MAIPTGDESAQDLRDQPCSPNIRNFDRFGRYGGEEFLLVLPDTLGDSAANILDRAARHHRQVSTGAHSRQTCG